MVKERVDERQMSGAMARPSSKSNQEAHIVAARNIAAQLFAFPTAEYPHLRTFVNEPEVEQKIFTNLGSELAPDIVVLEWPEKLPRMVAEVVTADMLTEENARGVWAVEARLEGVPFYLYVPVGYASEAKKLLKRVGLRNVGLRTWRNIAGLKSLDVAPLK